MGTSQDVASRRTHERAGMFARRIVRTGRTSLTNAVPRPPIRPTEAP